MGRGQQRSSRKASMETPDVGKAQSEIRSLQRRLMCVGAFVSLLTFTVTYLVCTNSGALWGDDAFFEGPDQARTEDLGPHLNTGSGNSSARAGDIDAKESEQSEAAVLDEIHDDSESGNSTLVIASTDSSGSNGTSSGSDFFEGAPSPAILSNSSSAVGNDTLLKESFENSTIIKESDRPSSSPTSSPSPSLSPSPSPLETTARGAENSTSKGECDLKLGNWIPDPRKPLYNSTTCKFIQEFQNCEKNGRPDDGFLYWKWKPDQCEVPRVDAAAFLNAMRSRIVVFAGDSIARNQFQSLLCVLSQVEVPEDTYKSADDRNHIYVFRSFNVTMRIHWAPYLVRAEEKPVTWADNSTDVVTHLHLDELDNVWVEAAVGADILQISTGQWWYKRGMYLQNQKVIGCHGYPACAKEIGFVLPYSIAMANILKGSLLQTPGFHGTTVYRSFAPDHFEGGDWSTGGACVRTVPGGVPLTFSAEWMYGVQIKQFQTVSEELGEEAKRRLKMLDITNMAQLRGDGHPNGYRRGRDKPADNSPEGLRNDCLHWCLPGPIDAWNDLLLHSLRSVITRE